MRYLVTASLVCLALIGWPAYAQSTAQINGTIRDAAGLTVPGSEVKATQTATGLTRTVTSGSDGTYILTNLPVGPYMVEVSKDGFSKYVQSGIVLQVDSNPTVDAALKVGSVTDQVTVQADAAQVETHSTGIGTVVDNQRVLEMPLNGRQATELIFLSGMATTAAGAGSLASVRNYPTVAISIAGGQGNSVTYNLDGVNHNDVYNNLNLPLPFPDALQEFKVETSALPAQYGYHSSAAINGVTKSGTNQFHGDLFEFLRNGNFNARNTFATLRDTLKRNQFGGVIGGPIKQNKLFFFGGYQGTTQRSEPNNAIAYVPTPQMMTGDFTTFASAQCQGASPKTLPASLGFTGNKIAPSLFSAVALNVQKTLPTPTDPCGKVNYGLKTNSNEHTNLVRMDYQINDKHSIFGRSYMAVLDQPTTYDGKNSLTVQTAASHYRVATLVLGDTYLIGSNIVNSFRLGANRVDAPKIPDDFSTWKALGVNAINIKANNPQFNVSGGNGFLIGGGSAIFGLANTGPNYNLADDVSWVRGAHQIGIGVNYIHTLLNSKTGVNAAGVMTYNGTISGLGMSDFLLGKAVSWRQGGVGEYYDRQHTPAGYIQDSWKVSSTLTVNVGVRWEPYLPFYAKYGQLMHFEQGQFDQAIRSNLYTASPAGASYPGDQSWDHGNSVARNRWNQFFPRAGLVWDPKGDGKMTIRASFGSFTDRINLLAATPFAQDAPYGSNITVNNPPNASDPWATYPGGNPLPIALSRNTLFPTFASFVTVNRDWKPTQLNQWNVSLQRQLGQDWLFTANYLGNNTSHLVVSKELNPAIYQGLGTCSIPGPNGTTSTFTPCSTTGNVNQRRLLYLQNPTLGQAYGPLDQIDDGGTGEYNALFISTNKRLSHGVSVLANYTWSHCIGDAWNAFPGNTAASAGLLSNRKYDRGNCGTADTRQLFNLSAVTQTPKFSSRALRLVASDWQISTIVGLRSAAFYSVTTGTDVALTGVGATLQRGNLLVADPYPANQSAAGWISRSAFAIPATGTYGNLGPNNMKGPGNVKLDLGISRTFTLHEKMTLQIRGEAFNLMNWVNLGLPISTLNSGVFGQIQSAGDPRIIQFASKFVF